MTPAGMIEQLDDWFHREFPNDEHNRWRIMFSGVQATDTWVLLIKWSVGEDKTGDLYSKRTFGAWEIMYCPPEVALGILSKSLAEMREEIIRMLDAQLEKKPKPLGPPKAYEWKQYYTFNGITDIQRGKVS